MDLPPDHPLLAVVAPFRVDRFFELAGLAADTPLVADFGGWSKLVLLSPDRAFLFARNHTQSEPLEREIAALEAVAAADLTEIPAVLSVWRDAGLGPYPIAALRRLPGRTLEPLLAGLALAPLAALSARIGALAARWHALPTAPLAHGPRREQAQRANLDALLGTGPDTRAPKAEAARVRKRLGLDAAFEQKAVVALERARALAPVIVHGDIHEGQILVDPDADLELTAILDWQTASIDHPFVEFNLGEWGPTIWREHRADFPELRRHFWRAYAPARGLEPDLGAVFEWTYAATHALDLTHPGHVEFGTDVTGTLEEAHTALRRATEKLPG